MKVAELKSRLSDMDKDIETQGLVRRQRDMKVERIMSDVAQVTMVHHFPSPFPNIVSHAAKNGHWGCIHNSSIRIFRATCSSGPTA